MTVTHIRDHVRGTWRIRSVETDRCLVLNNDPDYDRYVWGPCGTAHWWFDEDAAHKANGKWGSPSSIVEAAP